MPSNTRTGSWGWEPTPFRLASLAEELALRIPQPVDELEVAAVLESMGITDEVASQEFAEQDVFALAAQVFPILKAISKSNEADDTIADSGRSRRARQAANERAVAVMMLALGPLALLTLIERTLSGQGQGSARAIAALWGISAGMLLVAGPTFAIGRRSAILGGLGYVDQQRLYLRTRASWGVALLGLALGGFFLLAQVAGLSVAVTAAFAGGAAGLGLAWMLINLLLFAGRTRLVVGCLAFGCGTDLAVTTTVSPLLGLYTGASATLALLTAAALSLGRGVAEHVRSPRGALLSLESIPYAFYAVLAVAMMIAPATLAWLDDGGALPRAEAAGEVGLAFTAAIVPTAISLLFIERSMRIYWDFLRSSGEERGLSGFREAVRRFEAGRILHYAVVHAALSVTSAATFLLLTLRTDLELAIHRRDFFTGLAFYWLFGCIQFTGLLLVNLSKPWRAAAPLAVGLGIAAGASASAVLAGLPNGIPIIVAAAAAVGLAVALWNWNTVTRDIAYTYTSAF